MSYLDETEVATTQLFDSLGYYQKLLSEIKAPVCMFSATSDEDAQEKLDHWAREKRDEIDASLKRQRDYSAQQFSKDTICGAILQIAAMGLQLEGKRQAPPPEFCSLISAKKNPNARYFCCGQKVRGVPAGLIIYAARNQYNHQDESDLSELNRRIFDELAYNHGIGDMPETKDPAFDLDNPSLQVYAGNALYVLGWRSYLAYRKCMDSLLRTLG